MTTVPRTLPVPPQTSCNCFYTYNRAVATRQRLLIDDNTTRWERIWYKILGDTRKYPGMDRKGYFAGDPYLLIMYQTSLRRCWHGDPEWLKRKHWDWAAPLCWNMRNWYGIDPCEHWVWKRPKKIGDPNARPLACIGGKTLVMCRECGSAGDIICTPLDETLRLMDPPK